jgi:hypothetical protein
LSSGSLATERVDFVGIPSRDKERSRRFHGEYESRMGNMVFFPDPDGNELMLHRRYAP